MKATHNEQEAAINSDDPYLSGERNFWDDLIVILENDAEPVYRPEFKDSWDDILIVRKVFRKLNRGKIARVT